MEVFVVTGNKGKLDEIRQVLNVSGLVIRSVDELSDKVLIPEEDGNRFEENAAIKISPFVPSVGRIYLSDDSGLCVEALGGRPGIYSARYGGPGLDSVGQCRLLLEEMAGKNNRRAVFVCVVAIKGEDGNVQTFRGEVVGEIVKEMRGEHGFGYDPIFRPDGCDETFAEMGVEAKNRMSHRYRALMLARSFF